MTSHSNHVAALIARFPRLFRSQEPDLGIAVGAGWNALLIELLEKIDRLLDDAQAARFQIQQVKEKFAGLRVYYSVDGRSEMVIDLISPDSVSTIRRPPRTKGDFPREQVDQLIAAATARARVTCERCSRPGKLRQGRWMHVSCDACEARWATADDGDEI